MFTRKKPLLVGLWKRRSKGRRLNVEALEPRTVLSAIGVAFPFPIAEPPVKAALSSFPDAQVVARFAEASRPLRLEAVRTPGEDFRGIDFIAGGLHSQDALYEKEISIVSSDPHFLPFSDRQDPWLPIAQEFGGKVSAQYAVLEERSLAAFAPLGSVLLVKSWNNADMLRPLSQWSDAAPAAGGWYVGGEPATKRDGGWINVGLAHFELNRDPGREPPPVVMDPTAPRLTRPLGGLVAPHDAAPIGWSSSSPTQDREAHSTGATPAALPAWWTAAVSPKEGGFILMPVAARAGAENVAFDSTGLASAGQDRKADLSQSGSTNLKENSPHRTTALDDASPNPTSPFTGSRLSSENVSEGGLVDIETRSQGQSRSSRTDRDAASNSSRNSAEQEATDAIWRDFGADQSQEGPPVTGIESGALVDKTQAALGSGEGGMIELASAARSPYDLPDEPVNEPGEARGPTSMASQEIRMDKGVALFQAFELATAPGETSDGESTVGASDAALPPDPAITWSAAGSSASQQSASTSGELESPSGNRIMTVLGVAAAVALRRFRKGARSSNLDRMN